MTTLINQEALNLYYAEMPKRAAGTRLVVEKTGSDLYRIVSRELKWYEKLGAKIGFIGRLIEQTGLGGSASLKRVVEVCQKNQIFHSGLIETVNHYNEKHGDKTISLYPFFVAAIKYKQDQQLTLLVNTCKESALDMLKEAEVCFANDHDTFNSIFTKRITDAFNAVLELGETGLYIIDPQELLKICILANRMLTEAANTNLEYLKKEKAGLAHSLLLDYKNKNFTILGLGPIKARGGCAKVASSIEVVATQALGAQGSLTTANHLVVKKPLKGQEIDPFELECEKKYGELHLIVDYTKGKKMQKAFTTRAYEGGSLLDALNKGKIEPKDRYAILNALALQLEKMHQDGVIHGDLKPENVLFMRDENGVARVRICDFGKSYKADAKKKRACSGYGTDAYTAPELFKNPKNHTYSLEKQKAHDVYAFGLLAYGLFHHKDPSWFDLSDTLSSTSSDREKETIMKQVYKDQCAFLPFDSVKPSDRDYLFCRLLHPDPSKRMKLEEYRKNLLLNLT